MIYYAIGVLSTLLIELFIIWLALYVLRKDEEQFDKIINKKKDEAYKN